MRYIDHTTKTIYSGNRRTRQDPEVTSDPPDEYHSPVIKKVHNPQPGEAQAVHDGWELTREGKEKKKAAIKDQLYAIDSKYNSDRGTRDHKINYPDQYAAKAVERAKAAEREAEPLRAQLASLGH
ncbi:hypothetical protein LRD18_02945 [Halorhodospira halochloris]|uniref:hypothetical protein n=1 Tax=Halorhodospira halochloris TaxID=1052 RepID=UPI001EE896D8|nr:hypothetical protein [Halorhodospira halochloris]MCG5529832.1 hypothetical protein [Halorhodospira halochloris]MCG5547576.1 hypothetical protein [Halorhodospira halochloris]